MPLKKGSFPLPGIIPFLLLLGACAQSGGPGLDDYFKRKMKKTDLMGLVWDSFLFSTLGEKKTHVSIQTYITETERRSPYGR